MIKRESDVDKAVGMFNDRVTVLFDRIFPGVEKRITVRHNIKWFETEAKQPQIKCKNVKRNG